ncbi:MAG: chloride channel protein [Colwellia sp.]
MRKHLAFPKTSWQICFLAILGGIASALCVILFTVTIEYIQSFYITERNDYSSLTAIKRFFLPIAGAVVILFLAWLTGYQYLRTGIPFILHRLKVAHGLIPLKNTLNQFWGSAVALASGFSVGQEGPAVHLGAACSGAVGHYLRLPHNSIRTLAACGVAAGISATFNTPIAAVIFVMEVILREYKVHVFIPVMLASLVGSLITSNFFNVSHDFSYFVKVDLNNHYYLFLLALSVVIGVLSSVFNRFLVFVIAQSSDIHIVKRLIFAAIVTGFIGFFVPGAMGTDTNVFNLVLIEHWPIGLLLSLLIAKLVMTTFALGLGIPGGIVGPTLSIGAVTGACIGVIAVQVSPGEHVVSDFILMGMTGFMAASLNAPLAALLAIVELSGQLEIIVPAMFVITISSIISGQIFKNRSVFTMQLDVQGLKYRTPPIEKALQSVGVYALMKKRHKIIAQLNHQDIIANSTSAYEHNALILNENNSPNEERLNFITNSQFSLIRLNEDITTDNFDDKDIQRLPIEVISEQATLAQAYSTMMKEQCSALVVYNTQKIVSGIIYRQDITTYLEKGRLVK